MFSPQVRNRFVIGNIQRCSNIPTTVLNVKVSPPNLLSILEAGRQPQELAVL